MLLNPVDVNRDFHKHTELEIMAILKTKKLAIKSYPILGADMCCLGYILVFYFCTTSILDLDSLVRTKEHDNYKVSYLPSNICLNSSERRASDSDG